MKRIISLLTAIALLCSSLIFTVYADDADEGFDTGVIDFNDAGDINAALSQLNGTGYMSGAEVQNANMAGRGTVSVADLGGEFGKSIEIKNGGDGYATLRVMAAPIIKGNVSVGFSIRRTALDMAFSCAMKIGSDSYPLIFNTNGYVELCGNPMVKYEADTWYDVELAFNPISAKKAYMRLSMKKHGDDRWNTYDTYFMKGFWDAVPSNMTAGVNNIDFVYIGNLDEITYIDNIRCYTKGAENITQTMNSMNDDFSELPSFSHNDNNLTDYARQWRTYNFSDRCDASLKTVDGRQVMALSGRSGAAMYVTLGKIVRGLPDDTTSVIKFGLGFSDTSTTGMLITNDANNVLFNFASAISGSGGDWGGFEPNRIYDFQYVYNKSLGVSRILLAADDGMYETDAASQLSQSIDFQFNIPSGAEVYLSDFRYDIAGDGCSVTDSYIKSGHDTANLDDAIVFAFDQTISGKSNLVCEVRESGETAYKPCTAAVKLDMVEVEPGIMKPDTEYEVRLSGAQSIFGTPAAEATHNFRTVDFDIEANAPVMNGSDVTVFVKSAYSKGAPVSVIALAQDADGNPTEAIDSTVTADSREGAQYKVSPKFSEPYSSVRLLVWDGIAEATAYAPSALYGGVNTQPSGADGNEPISDVRLDKSAGKLYISGYNNSDKYNTAVVEVLRDGVLWSADGSGAKSLDGYDPSNDSILDYLCYLTQIDNLGKNKPYTVALNYTGDKLPKIMVRFGRDDAVYYDSDIIERVNNAATGEELKNILLGDDYVKKAIGDLYNERISDEGTVNAFWNYFLERKNKAYGTDAQFTSMYRIVNALKDNINLTLIKLADTADKMNAVISTLKQDKIFSGNSADLYFGEGVYADKSYMSADSKKAFIERMISDRNSYETTAEFAGDITVRTLLHSVCGNDSKYNVYDIIMKSDLINKDNIASFTALKKLAQIEVCDKINTASAPYDSVAALESAICSCAAGENGGNSGNSGNSGGGSGGGRGGNLSSSTGTISNGNNGGSPKYTDLDSVPWAKTAIDALTARNIVSGIGDGRFAPSDTVKREEFVKMLMGVVNIAATGTGVEFADADKNAWYWQYVSKAAASGIVLGVNDTEFGIGAEITREQMAAMVYRAVTAGGVYIVRTSGTAFADSDSISDYAKEAAAFMSETGIMNGKSGGMFDPSSTATRAEAAKVIYELLTRTEASR